MMRLPLSISRSTSLSAGADALGYLKVSPLMTTDFSRILSSDFFSFSIFSKSGFHSGCEGGGARDSTTINMSDMLWLELLALAGDEGTRNMTGELHIGRSASNPGAGLQTWWWRGKRWWVGGEVCMHDPGSEGLQKSLWVGRGEGWTVERMDR
jgi:hypothetical protein